MEEIKKYFQDIVPFNTAQRLHEVGHSIVPETGFPCYSLQDKLGVFNRNSKSYRWFEKGELFNYFPHSEVLPGGYHGDFMVAPTWAQVLDWFLNKGIVIELTPGFTYALKSNLGFEYTVHMVVEGEGLKSYPGKEFASFPLCMHDAVEHAIKIYKDEHEKD